MPLAVSDASTSSGSHFNYDFSRVRVQNDTKAETITPKKTAGTFLPLVSPSLIEDDGKIGVGKVEGELVAWEGETANLNVGEVNEWGEIDGTLTSDVFPLMFVDNGKTGSGIVHWAGGNGGQGNQNAGEITLIAPQYESRNPVNAGESAQAWIRPGTGKATVTRSYRGVLTGANGPNYYFTGRAAARGDHHEQLHVNSSRSIHNTFITPLDQAVDMHTGEAKALKSGSTNAQATTALQNLLDWNTRITNFRNADVAANQPMGTVDTADMATADFIRDYGPRAVASVNYAHYIDIPPGP